MTSSPPADDTGMRNLKRYTYFHCLAKLENRLSASVPQLRGGTLEGLIQHISLDAIINRWTEPTSKLPGDLELKDETWLIDEILAQCSDSAQPQTREKIANEVDGGIKQLTLEDWTAGFTFETLQTTLKRVRNCVSELTEIKGKTDTAVAVASAPRVEVLLDALTAGMETLSWLTHQSRCLWYAIEGSVVREAFAGSVRLRL